MKLIKILGKESYFLDNIVNGESIEITKSAESIEFFTLQKSLENQTRYIVELSPDENNPLNYDGITIALKIYFKHLQEKLYEFEILLFGFDTKESIFLNNDYSFFLKCPNVHYKTLNFTNHWHLENHIIPIPKEEAKIALKKLGIKPPSSYKTQHSITNEWAIFRWSSYLGIKTSLEKEITNSLYFQYLITIHEIEPIASKQNFLPAKGKILVIDDEIDKGWEDFFKSLKFPSDKDLKLETIGKGFKSLENQEQVIDLIEEKIRIFNPDIIILDLRLLDADFEEKDTKKITGFKVLEKIKNEINRGIQVILFTASNKVWNYQSLLEVGFDGWVVKESPELSTDPFYTKNAIKDLKLQIEMCLSRSNYLSPAWLIHNKIKENLEVASKEKRIDKKISNEIKSFLKPSYKMYESASSKEDFAFSYLALFKTLEYIANEYTFKDSDSWQITGLKPLNQYLWNNTTYSYEKIMTPNFKNNTPSLFEKIASICFQLLG
ncbi:MAG: response regulator [Flavobacteriaceae bacterium]|nr:response regulator [Flavobacteriaceae bacterium]